ncbi:hypothetical protein ACS0TY_011083 [Phlomoides rotata]
MEGLRFSQKEQEPEKKTILDPGSETVLKWNRIFLFSCLVALFVDPLFFFLPSVLNKHNSTCMHIDLNLGIIVTCFRTLADVLYFLHIFIKFRTTYVSPSSRVFGKGELVMNLDKIANRYLKSEFLIDIIAALHLPQYIPRLYLIFPFEFSNHQGYRSRHKDGLGWCCIQFSTLHVSKSETCSSISRGCR